MPPSNIAIVGIYAFSHSIYNAIEGTSPDKNGEVQLTNAIQCLVDRDCTVCAVELGAKEKRVGIGSPESCLNALNMIAKQQ